jgi:hypothetical protein
VAHEFDALGDPVAKADATRLLGLTWLAAGRIEPAEQAIASALATAIQYNNTLLEAECHRAYAELRLVALDLVGARTHVVRAIGLYEQLGATSDASETREWASEQRLAL